MKIAIIIGKFHKKEMDIMLEEARNICIKKDMQIDSEIWVPGSLEVPLVLNRILAKSDIDGAIVLGIIERWSTKHGMVMWQAVTDKILDIQITHNKPVGMWLLWPEILPDQIEPRIRPYAQAAAKALYEMYNISV